MKNNFFRRWTIPAITILVLMLNSCDQKSQVQEIIDKSIEAHGGDYYNHVFISFDFRDRSYSIRKEDGKFEYTRTFVDSIGVLKDYYNNDGYYRTLDGERIDVVDSMAVKYTNSVNSVIYFAMTPFVLNDPAVRKEYLGLADVKGRKYHKVKITFGEKGGGKDHEDVFVYWFDEKTYLMDYFSYLYYTDGGGTRFREIYNPRKIGNILFVDHVNYKYDAMDTDITDFDQLFEDNQLIELSRIELKNIKVEHLK
jgi:hypothetical protein